MRETERGRGKGKKRYFPLLLFPPSESARMAFGEKGVEGEGEREREKETLLANIRGWGKEKGKGFWVVGACSFFSLSLSFLPAQPCDHCWKMEIRSLSIGASFRSQTELEDEKGGRNYFSSRPEFHRNKKHALVCH